MLNSIDRLENYQSKRKILQEKKEDKKKKKRVRLFTSSEHESENDDDKENKDKEKEQKKHRKSYVLNHENQINIEKVNPDQFNL